MFPCTPNTAISIGVISSEGPGALNIFRIVVKGPLKWFDTTMDGEGVQDLQETYIILGGALYNFYLSNRCVLITSVVQWLQCVEKNPWAPGARSYISMGPCQFTCLHRSQITPGDLTRIPYGRTLILFLWSDNYIIPSPVYVFRDNEEDRPMVCNTSPYQKVAALYSEEMFRFFDKTFAEVGSSLQ